MQVKELYLNSIEWTCRFYYYFVIWIYFYWGVNSRVKDIYIRGLIIELKEWYLNDKWILDGYRL